MFRPWLAGVALTTLAMSGLSPALGQSPAATSPPALITTPTVSGPLLLGEQDRANVQAALSAARSGDVSRMRAARDSISDPVARKLALWAMIDNAASSVTFLEVDAARRDLAGWPRAAKRQAAAERLIETAGLSPAQTIAWFDRGDPATAEGAMALAAALRASGRAQEATDVIRRCWRGKVFEADVQARMLARFGDSLTADDHAVRANLLLFGQQGPAARDMLALLTPEQRNLAEIRIGLRSGSSNANDRIGELPQTLLNDPGLVFEKAAWFRKRKQEDLAIKLVSAFPKPPSDEAAARIWIERRGLVVWGLRNHDDAGAYAAAADAGLPPGADAAEAEFYAGWIALSRLKDPDRAARHFANLAAIGASPITSARALYWQGRAAEAQRDPIAAQSFYSDGARYLTTFYGQLAAEKVGVKTLVLGADPQIGPADRARFEGREPVRAATLLADLGERDLFKVFVLNIADTLPTAQESALLIDLARRYNDQDLGMRAARSAAQRGFVLPERAYPIINRPDVPGGAEPAYVFSITRQESNFDPSARSSPGARGLMQLMPATGAHVARKLGEPYSVDRLFQADYNLRLGSLYLGDMVANFSGSYAMASAAYNAGPGRPTEWAALCGDPRGGATDPLDFIECIPFSETRNYVMRTLETMIVYRARLNGGQTPLTLSSDLKRGAYGGVGGYAVLGTSGGR